MARYDKNTIISRMLHFEKSFIGMDYSQSPRYNIYRGGSTDCSGLQMAAMAYAGYPLRGTFGEELATSIYQVNARGYNSIYPPDANLIGSIRPSPSDVITKSNPQPGDLVFYTFNSAKISHVGAVLDAQHIIHTSNNREKLCVRPITWGKNNIVAIRRMGSNARTDEFSTIRQGSSGITVKTLRMILNCDFGHKFQYNGTFDDAVTNAVISAKRKLGLPANGVVDTETWEAFFDNAKIQQVTGINYNDPMGSGYTNPVSGITGDMTPIDLSTIDFKQFTPYLATVDRTTRTIDYDKLKSFAVIGMMIEAGYLFEHGHTEVSSFQNPKLKEQALGAAKADLPFALYMPARATTVADAKREIDELRYSIFNYPPTLGMWLQLDLGKDKAVNKKIIKHYYDRLVALGLIRKIGFYTTREQLDLIDWEALCEDWDLWLIDPVKDVTEFQQVLTPQFFMWKNQVTTGVVT